MISLNLVRSRQTLIQRSQELNASGHGSVFCSAMCVAMLVCLLLAIGANGQVITGTPPQSNSLWYQYIPEVTITIPAGTYPEGVAVNPVTNKVYITNYGSNNMTVFDPLTLTTSTVSAGSRPSAVVLNPVTNKVYVANEYNIVVFDEGNGTASTIATGGARCLAVNTATNKIYACNDKGVVVIDGASNTTTLVPTGTLDGYRARTIAVNPVTNKIYVGNSDWIFTVIDGATNATTEWPVSYIPQAIAVNPATNKIYVACNNMSVGHLTVLDGATHAATEYQAGTWVTAVAVNPATNKIYVTNHYTTEGTYVDDVLVLDGDSGVLTTLMNGGNGARAVVVNPVTNKIYITRDANSTITEMDGATNVTTGLAGGQDPWLMAVNASTGQVFVTNRYDGNVTAVGPLGVTSSVTVKETDLLTPRDMAVNPVTNKVYVTNSGSNRTPGPVTIIDGNTNMARSVVAEIGERVVVNPATNKIYIGHGSTSTLAIFDGATEQVSRVEMRDLAFMALNPDDNKLYLTNYSSNVSVLNPTTNQISTINVGGRTQFLAVNPATNKIYVTNDANTTVIDGATGQILKVVADANRAEAVTVNPRTNRIYVSNTYDSSLTVIDGTDDTVIAHVTTGLYPAMSVVNPQTNRLYVVESWGIRVVDGATNSVITLVTINCSTGCTIAINPAINKVYVTQTSQNGIAILDGVTNKFVNVNTGDGPTSIAINPANNKVYVANYYDDSVTVLGDSFPQVPLKTDIQPLVDNLTSDPAPTFDFTVTNGYSPHAAAVQSVYYQVDSKFGPWLKAQASGDNFTGQLTDLWPGNHTMYAFATDGMDATAIGIGENIIGMIGAYSFSVGASASPAAPELSVSPEGVSIEVLAGYDPSPNTFTVTNTGGGTLNWTAGKTQTWLSLGSTTGTAPSTTTFSISTAGLTPGSYSDEITIAAAGALRSPQVISVALKVVGEPVLSVDVSALEFTAVQGGSNPAAKLLGITNTGGGTLSWAAAKTQSWLSLDTASGPAPAMVAVSIDVNGLAPGTYDDIVTITSPGNTGSPKTVTVTLTVQPPPAVLSVSVASLTFSATVGENNPAAQAVAITNTGGGTLSWTAAKTQPWLAIDASSGTGPATIHASASISGVAVGTYHDTITITAAGVTGSPKTVDVNLTIQAAPDFQMGMASGSSPSATVSAGGSANYSITVTPMNNFSGMTTMSCSGLPTASSCTFSPSQQMVSGTTAMPFSLTITTTNRVVTGGMVSTLCNFPWTGMAMVLSLLVSMMLLMLNWRRPKLILASVVLIAVGGLAACGGHKNPPTVSGTPAGTYPIVVIATSGTTTHNTTVTLTVN